jgi:hypothetical protein
LIAARLGRLADPDALQSNLYNEIAASDGMAVLPALITAWTRR